jgi:hypothetical protein
MNEFDASEAQGPAPGLPVPEPAAGKLPIGEPASREPPVEEPPIVRHDPFASTRAAPWMNRGLSPSGRAAAFLRRVLEDFPAVEGREPNHADLDAIVRRTVDTMVPIFRRERATDIAYEELEKRRAGRMAGRRVPADSDLPEGFVRVSGGQEDANVGPSLAQLGPEARDERIRSQKWRSPSDDGEYLKALEGYRGRRVRLPDGSLVPDPYSPTGVLMSPVDDLKEVARAGQAAGSALFLQGGAFAMLAPDKLVQHSEQVEELFRRALAQGGEFDYQRKAAVGGRDGFVQLRQFRNVSNFNVGLFMQQAGFPLKATLKIAGWYAERNSSNHRPDQPYGLDPQTKEFIEQGHAAGKSGMFD